MTKRGILGAALGLLLTMTLGTASAAAYAGQGFSLEVPEDWIPDTQVESIAYGWTNPEVTQEVTVSIADNDDFLNLYDLKEDDLPDIEELVASQYAQRLAESYQAQGHECTVRLEDTGVTSAEWSDGQPAVLIDCRFTVTWAENGGEFPVYLHMGIQTSPSHTFVVAYMANDAGQRHHGVLPYHGGDLFRPFQPSHFLCGRDFQRRWNDAVCSFGMVWTAGADGAQKGEKAD